MVNGHGQRSMAVNGHGQRSTSCPTLVEIVLATTYVGGAPFTTNTTTIFSNTGGVGLFDTTLVGGIVVALKNRVASEVYGINNLY